MPTTPPAPSGNIPPAASKAWPRRNLVSGRLEKPAAEESAWMGWADAALSSDDPAKRKEALAQWAALPADAAAKAGAILAERADVLLGAERAQRLWRFSSAGEWALKAMAARCAENASPFEPRSDAEGRQKAGWGASLLKIGAGAACVKAFKAARPQDFDARSLSQSAQLPPAALAAAQMGAHPAVLAEIGRQCGFEWPCARFPLPDESKPAGLFWRLLARESARARNFKALARFARVLDLREPLLGGPCAFSEWVAACASKTRIRFHLPRRDDGDWAKEPRSAQGSEQSFWKRFERLQALCDGLPPEGSPAAHPQQRRALWICAQSARWDKNDPKRAEREKSIGEQPPPDALGMSEGIWMGQQTHAEATEWAERFAQAAKSGGALAASAARANEWPPAPWDAAEARLWERAGVDWLRARMGPPAQTAISQASRAQKKDAKNYARTAARLLSLPLPAASVEHFVPWRLPELAEGFNECWLNASLQLAAREIFENWAPQERVAAAALAACARLKASQGDAPASATAAAAGPREARCVDDALAMARQLLSRGASIAARQEILEHGSAERWRRQGDETALVYRIGEAPDFMSAFAQAWGLWESALLAQASLSSPGAPSRARGRAPRAL